MSIVVNKTRLPVTNWQTKSGAIVSIDDARQRLARSLKVNMLPQQDLHGYENPWPAGGGKNLLNPDTFSSRDSFYTINSNGTITVTADDTTGWSNIPVMPLKAGTYEFSRKTVGGKCFIRTSDDNYATNKMQITSTTYGSFTLAQDGGIKLRLDAEADSYPITQEYQIEVGSTATSWTPYSNICPISGRSEVRVTRTGKNLLNPSNVINGKFIRAAVPSESSPIGSEVSNASWDCSPYMKVAPQTQYTTIIPSYQSAGGAGIVFFSDKSVDSAISGVSCYAQGNAVYAFTTPQNCHYVRFSWAHDDNVDAFIGVGTQSVASPYTGTTYPVSFPVLSANQWDEEWEQGLFNTTTGANTSSATQIRAKNKISVQPSTEYYVKSQNSTYGDGLWIMFFDSSENVITENLPSGVASSGNSREFGQDGKNSFTTPNNCYFIRFYTQSHYGGTYNHDIAINYPSSVTTYEPYTTTVYSGYLDLVSGELVVAWKEINLGSMGWIKRASYFQSDNLADAKTYSSYYAAIDAICSSYKIGTVNSTPQNNWSICVTINSGRLLLRDDSLFDLDATAFASAVNGVQYVYELATPLTFHLTPQQIQMLVRDNTVWSDADSVEVEYAVIHSH